MHISEFMSGDHQRCDTLFAHAEQVVSEGNWEASAVAHEQFIVAMEHHLGMEEETLFPRFEVVSGMTMGPTQMMRHEHQQMRQLFAQMSQAVEAQSVDDYLGAAETLLILMQQHNAKEQQILYPMTDQVLAAESEQMVAKLQG